MSKPYASPFTWTGMKRNPSVLPVVGCMVLGVGLAVAYTLRLALFNPDVTWNSRKKPEPWQDYEHKEYKLYMAEPYDPKTYQHPRPRF